MNSPLNPTFERQLAQVRSIGPGIFVCYRVGTKRREPVSLCPRGAGFPILVCMWWARPCVVDAIHSEYMFAMAPNPG